MNPVDDVIVLIPSHSLEDFPTDIGEKDAASLLNAFAVAWHPRLLVASGVIPSWHRSDEPPDECHNRVFLIPTASDEGLPHNWLGQAREQGAVVVSGISDRGEMAEAAIGLPVEGPAVSADLVADFYALGTCHLMIELLTRYMHHFDSPDEVCLQREVLAAAEAALAQDVQTARVRLRSCFECLTEYRERFYPVDCFLIDLVLLVPDGADEHLARAVAEQPPLNVLATAADLETIAAGKAELTEQLGIAWGDGHISLVGGERREGPAPLLPLESVLCDFLEGSAVFQRLFNRLPKTWGRRRYGFSTLLPQILGRIGFDSALHVALDDGIYPDAESSRIRWEGCDGTVIDAMSRIPLAADSAGSFIRFAQRMAETMEQDMVAALTLARWPDVTTPWLDDLRRMSRYSTTLGRFVTYDDFIRETDTPGSLTTYSAKEYLTPFLVQSVAREQPCPISRFVRHFEQRQRFDTANWLRGVTGALLGRTPITRDDAEREATLEQGGPDAEDDAIRAAQDVLTDLEPDAAAQLAGIVMQGAGNQPGCLVLNPLSFARVVTARLPDSVAVPEVGKVVKAVQADGDRRCAVLEVPGSGFVWLSGAATAGGRGRDDGPPLAEPCLVRNEFFEVHINEQTGGIARIKGYGRQPNRLSQQVAFRFPRERTIRSDSEQEEPRTPYSEMRCLDCQISSAGPALGEIVSTGDILDQQTNTRLAGFRQQVRVWRGRRAVELDIELFDIVRMPEGDPWSNYFASRFAWNDPAASLTRSVLGQAQSFHGERIESPHYLEIASEDERTTILMHGLPFHRKIDMRMLDSILIVAGEQQTRFRFTIAIDALYPMEAALDAMTPPSVVATTSGPPRTGNSGWFFHISARNVQITRIMNLMAVPVDDVDSDADNEDGGTAHDVEAAAGETGTGFALRLVETEGRQRQVRLQCFRTPSTARQRDFLGRTLQHLDIDGDDVLIEMGRSEIADVELRFD